MTKKEEEKFAGELSSILDYVEKLKEVDIKNIGADFRLAQEVSFEKGMREDKTEEQNIETVKKLIKSAPSTKDNYIKVKSILK